MTGHVPCEMAEHGGSHLLVTSAVHICCSSFMMMLLHAVCTEHSVQQALAMSQQLWGAAKLKSEAHSIMQICHHTCFGRFGLQ